VVWKPRRFASRVSEGLVGLRPVGGDVRVYSVYGLGFGSDVTVVVRLDESLDRSGSLYGGRDLC
jgi:hypothetical protein